MTPEVAADVGRRLAAARLQRGLSQGTVGRLAGLAPSYVSRIENGRVHPTFRTVLKIAAALRITPEEILDPPAPGGDRGPRACPVSRTGRCILDLIRTEWQVEHGGDDEAYTPRQLRLLRRFAAWVRLVPGDRLRAMEILVEDLGRGLAARDDRQRG